MADANDDLRKYFNRSESGAFMQRTGPANTGVSALNTAKICLTATDEGYLVKTLYEVSLRADCVGVKYSPIGSPKSRDGMLLGRIFLTTFEESAKLWSQLYKDSKLMCNLQNDVDLDKYRA